MTRTGVRVWAYGALAVAAVVSAYWMIFTQFAAYDDEGTGLATLLLFNEGQPLYDDVVTQYGPFYFEVYGALTALTGREITHDIGRMIVVAEWTAASVLMGIACERLTRSLLLGLAGMASAFGVLGVLTAEPMHPVGLVVVLTAMAVLALIGPVTGRRGAAGAAVLGFAVAGLAMTKVNLGVFALAGLALAAAFTWPWLAGRRTLAWLVAAGFLAMPLVLMGSDLGNAAVRDLIFLSAGAGGALVVAAHALGERPGARPPEGLTRWLGMAALAFVVTAVLSLIVILFTGPSLADVYDGMVVTARRTREALLTPLALPKASAWWAVASLAGAVVAVRVSAGARDSGLWPGVGRVLVGLGMWLTVAKSAPFDLGPTSSGLEPAMALAWVAVLPPAVTEERIPRFARIALPAMALAGALQVYPVAGTQVGSAKLLFVPVGAVCLGDGLAQLRAWAERRGVRVDAVAPVVAGALAAVLAWTLVIQPGIGAGTTYADRQPLPLEGAQRVRPPAQDVATYTRLVSLLRQRCSALAGYPSVNSLYLWSGIDPPRGGLTGPWMHLLTPERQQRVVDELRRADRPCALRNRQLEFFWMRGRAAPDTPLVRYIADDFRVAEEVNGYELLVPSSGAGTLDP